MNKKLSTILTIVLSLTTVGLAFVPHTANAVTIDLFPDFVVNNILTTISYVFLTLMSGLVTIAGTFLSVSINITMHIKEIFDKIPGIGLIWVTVRDLSSIFIIFVLLYVSIKMILGLKGANFGQLVVNVFLAGMLINFSLFFVKVAVDASNLISLQFYNAIAPQTSQNWTVNSAFYDGGLSNIFLQSLKVQTVYNAVDLTKNEGIAGSIIIATIGGGVMMLVAAFSFFAAAIAFTVRTAILFVIMALSPLYFVGMIFPEVKKQVSDRIMGMLKGQLIFMPVYLFLMYVALRIISDPQFMAIFNSSTPNGDKGFLGAMSLGVIIQYVIAIVFINLPLFAAIKMGAVGASWAPQAKDFGGFLGRNIIGRGGQLAGKGFDYLSANAQKSKSGRFVSGALSLTGVARNTREGLSTVEKGKYGGKESLVDVQKYDKERGKFIGSKKKEMDRLSEIDSHIKNSSPFKDVKGTISKMSTKELEDLDKRIKNPVIAAAMSSKQAENLLKSDISDVEKEEFKEARKEGLKTQIASISSSDIESILKEDFSDAQKDEIKAARKDQLTAVSGDRAAVEEYMKNLSGKELSKITPATLTNRNVMDYLTPAHLKDMEDTLDRPTKQMIARYVSGLPETNTHKAFCYFSDARNLNRWLA